MSRYLKDGPFPEGSPDTHPANPDSPPFPPKANRLWGLILVVAIILAYQPVWHAGFIWDDNDYVTENPLLTAPGGLKRIWFSTDSPSQYFPLVYTTFRAEHAIWGLNAAGYHWVNILLHAANALLVWRLLGRLKIPGAWLAAAIFALHPVQVESVAWITERKNVLSMFFSLLTLLAWLGFIDGNGRKKWRCYAAALACCALALFSKTTACTLPAPLLLILWLKHRPIDRRRWMQIIPFLALGAGMGLLTVWWERYHQGTQGNEFALGFGGRMLVAGHAIWFYLGKLLWPAKLTFSYPRWTLHAWNPLAYGWLAALAATSYGIYRARKTIGRGGEVAGLYYVATLSPMLGFIMLYTFRYSFVADHYQYAAAIGPIALASAGIATLAESCEKFRNAIYTGAGVIVVALGLLTWKQCHIYRDDESIWRDTLAKNPGSWLAYNDLGVNLRKKGKLDDAIALFRKALEFNPGNESAHYNLGYALGLKGNTAEAIEQYQMALEILPAFPEAHNDLGQAFQKTGQTDQAMEQYRIALQILPGFADAHKNLGVVLQQKGQINEAIAQFKMALESAPNMVDAHIDLGNAFGETGDMKKAIEEFKKALEIAPDYATAHYDLGLALQQEGFLDDAIAQYEKALKITPSYPEAHLNIGLALQKKGDAYEAIAHYEKALEIKPGFPGALNNLAYMLAAHPDASLRNGAKALQLARQANEATGGGNPIILSTLAAAYAETGQYPDAVKTAQRALELADSQSNAELAGLLNSQIVLYKASAPFRDQSLKK